MNDDVRRLVRRAGWPADAYQEVAALQYEDEAARVWPLIAAVNRCLAAPAGEEAAPAARVPAELSPRTVVQWRL